LQHQERQQACLYTDPPFVCFQALLNPTCSVCVESNCVCCAVCVSLQTTPTLGPPSHWGCPSWAIYMGFEHERIHIETSSVLIREVRQQAQTVSLVVWLCDIQWLPP
jgi:hypothetical protein